MWKAELSEKTYELEGINGLPERHLNVKFFKSSFYLWVLFPSAPKKTRKHMENATWEEVRHLLTFSRIMVVWRHITHKLTCKLSVSPLFLLHCYVAYINLITRKTTNVLRCKNMNPLAEQRVERKLDFVQRKWRGNYVDGG